MSEDGEDAPCPGDNTLETFVAEKLSAQRAQRVLSHLDRCPTCRAIVKEVAHPPAALSQDPPQDLAASSTPEGWSPPGQIEEYRLLRPLGRGAMGQVYLAHDTRLDRPVAIKFIAAAEPAPAIRDRFLIEARAIARLSHPNIVAVHRVGEVQGRPYLVSELVRGRSLDQLPLPLPPDRVLPIALGLARGLAAAHRCGVLHRDIKPANVMLTDDGEVKLLDFGLAKLLDALPLPVGEQVPAVGVLDATVSSPRGPGLDLRGSFVGTPFYMAPEVWRTAPATPAADIYSMGITLYQLCCGHVPHEDGERGTFLRRVQEEDVQPLAARAPGLDPGLAQIIHRCLARDPAARFPSGVELAAALDALHGRRGEHGQAAGGARRSRLLTAALFGGVLLPAAGLLFLYGRGLPWRSPERVRLAGGEFTMGSTEQEVKDAFEWSQVQECQGCKRSLYEREQPAHTVRLSPFSLDRTEVTNSDFAAWLNRLRDVSVEDDRLVRLGGVLLADVYTNAYGPGGVQHQDGRFVVRRGHERLPVVHVTWDAARLYCQDQGQRLPTEAEWEFAARGTSRRGDRFPWGEDLPRCDGVVYGRPGGDDPDAATCSAALGTAPGPVGTAAQDRTPEGIVDLGGNVAEWVQDRFVDRYPGCGPVCRDPVVEVDPAGGPDLRVQRGGAWYRGAEACRAAGRSRLRRDQARGDVGFRCAGSGVR